MIAVMRRLRPFYAILFGTLFVLILSACEADHLRDATGEGSSASTTGVPGTHSEVCAAGLGGFQTEFLAHVQDEVCTGCHDGKNPAAPSWLLGPDPQIYLTVKNYVTFADVTQSRIYIRAGNRHCGGACNDDMAARMKGYLQKWWQSGESTCDQSTTLRTASQPIPTSLPHDGYATMSWDLSTISVDLRGVQVALEVKKFTDAEGPTPGSYSIRKPRFISDHPVSLAVEKMRILNNLNIQDAANQFERVHAVVTPDVTTGTQLTYPVMSPETTTLIEEHPGADQLMVTFGKISTTTPRACRAMDKFTSEVVPVVEARSCKGCHAPGSASPRASALFDMSGDNTALCAKFLGRTWTDDNVLPALIQFPLNGRFEHPRVFVGQDNVLPDWNDWMHAEWAP
jgi:hypothetical protein